MTRLEIGEVRLHFATPDARDSGLLAWVTLVVNSGLRIDGIALRRTRDGRLTLSFPEKRDAAGRARPLVRPISTDARLDIERQVFAALGGQLEEGAA